MSGEDRKIKADRIKQLKKDIKESLECQGLGGLESLGIMVRVDAVHRESADLSYDVGFDEGSAFGYKMLQTQLQKLTM